MCKRTETMLFADDTSLFSGGSNAITLQDGVNDDLAIIAELPKVNKSYNMIIKNYNMI